ncbi:hypothetical protein N7493_004592 [Penicillium malachiteum]|uniref:Uncharacterized protein n=1 Tax=Penicillium malachiteum TaxID=1324776 RepID=A0AAD6MXF7_9EURO|nr:hypothetical protein N7493_004592 [Penicillium malachiteum]
MLYASAYTDCSGTIVAADKATPEQIMKAQEAVDKANDGLAALFSSPPENHYACITVVKRSDQVQSLPVDGTNMTATVPPGFDWRHRPGNSTDQWQRKSRLI